MKVRYYIEGAGCSFAQCGLHKGSLLNIPDEDIKGFEGSARERMIDELVQDDFDRSVSLVWEIEE